MSEPVHPLRSEHGVDVELRLKALLDAIPDLVFRITADGTYLDFAGDAYLLSNPRENVVGGTVHDLLPPDVATLLLATINRALESGTLQTADYVLRRTWRSWREQEDCSGPSYARFLCNCGETLIRAARFRNPHDRDKDFAAC